MLNQEFRRPEVVRATQPVGDRGARAVGEERAGRDVFGAVRILVEVRDRVVVAGRRAREERDDDARLECSVVHSRISGGCRYGVTRRVRPTERAFGSAANSANPPALPVVYENSGSMFGMFVDIQRLRPTSERFADDMRMRLARRVGRS